MKWDLTHLSVETYNLDDWLHVKNTQMKISIDTDTVIMFSYSNYCIIYFII